MAIAEYNSEEEMDDTFEEMMEFEQDKARLREEIEELEYKVISLDSELLDAKEELEIAEQKLLEWANENYQVSPEKIKEIQEEISDNFKNGKYKELNKICVPRP